MPFISLKFKACAGMRRAQWSAYRPALPHAEGINQHCTPGVFCCICSIASQCAARGCPGSQSAQKSDAAWAHGGPYGSRRMLPPPTTAVGGAMSNRLKGMPMPAASEGSAPERVSSAAW